MMTREELLKKVREDITVPLSDNHEMMKVFYKFGSFNNGIGLSWAWNTEADRERGRTPLSDATNAELYEMWALSCEHWMEKYKAWYNSQSDEIYELQNKLRKINATEKEVNNDH